MNKSYIKKASYYGVAGSIGIMIASSLTGCEKAQEEAQNMFIIMQERADGGYDVVEKHPTEGPSRAIVRDINGNERMMSNEELTMLAQQEAQRVDSGASSMGNSGGGMSMGEAILAAATGAILGNLIGNALANKMANNPKFQAAQRQAANKTSAIQRSATSKPSGASSASKPKSGYFGNQAGSTSKSSSYYGG